MGCFQKHAALVVAFGLLLLLTCEAAASGVPSSSTLHERKLLNNSKIQTLPSLSGESSSRCGAGRYSAARMGPDDCSEENVVVYQNSANPLPSGIPTYTVQIINVCGGCRVSDVHVSCGDFASTELVDPGKFQRVGFNDCIVNGGGPMEPSETISFQYSQLLLLPAQCRLRLLRVGAGRRVLACCVSCIRSRPCALAVCRRCSFISISVVGRASSHGGVAVVYFVSLVSK
uniref:TPD1 n=1 Tax=Arundo donax TaxID=35708 RepID=A0A0A8Y2J7_ARUDO